MLSILVSLLATVQPSAVDEPVETIVVEARRAESDLESCLARRCPPAEEIEAFLTVAVARFSVGDMVSASRAVDRAIARNWQYRDIEPERVASLYATGSALAEYEGRMGPTRHHSLQSLRVLRDRPDTEPNLSLIDAQIVVGDMFAGFNHQPSAFAAYRRAREMAHAIGETRIVAITHLQEAALAFRVRAFGDARRYAGLALAAAPEDGRVQETVALLNARIDALRGDTGPLSALAARAGSTPMVIDSLSYSAAGLFPEQLVTLGGLQWVDLGFWIRPDGSVGDIAVVRGARHRAWSRAAIRQIGSRRYTPLSPDAADTPAGLYRLERFVVRGEADANTDRRMQRPGQKGGLLVTDITDLDDVTTPTR